MFSCMLRLPDGELLQIFEDVQIDLRSFRLFKGGRAVSVEPKALILLIFLVENRGRLVRKRELMEAVRVTPLLRNRS